MRILPLRTSCALCLATGILLSTSAEDEKIPIVDELPRYDTLRDWAEAVRRPSFVLVHAVEKSGVRVCVFRTGENNLVFCHDKAPGIGLCSSTLGFRDSRGERIRDPDYDFSRDRERPEPNGVFYSRVKLVHDRGWNVHLLYEGTLYGLRQPVPEAFRMTYVVRPEDGSPPIRIDEIVDFFQPFDFP